MEIHAPSLTPDEKQALREFFPVYEQHRHHAEAALRELVEQTGFGRLLGSVPEPSAEQQRRSLEQVRQALLDGEWPPYLAALAEQGSTYARLGVEFSEWFLLSRAFRAALTPRVHEHYVDGDRAQRALIGLNLHVDIGMETIGSAYLDTKEAIIGAQRASIQELSTPVLQVRPRLLIVPLIGVIDTHRARQLTEALLRAIRGRRARAVVMDVTGVPLVDSKVASHLMQTVDAARLMGATVIVTGISPEIAQTLVTIGAELRDILTAGDLEEGLSEAERLLAEREARAAAPHGGAP